MSCKLLRGSSKLLLREIATRARAKVRVRVRASAQVRARARVGVRASFCDGNKQHVHPMILLMGAGQGSLLELGAVGRGQWTCML